MHKAMWYFWTIHVTLRMTIMLSIVGSLNKEGETLEPWLFDGKVENPWLEAKTKHVRELLVFENREKILLRSATFQSTVNSKCLSISPMPTILMLFAYTFVPLSIYNLTVYGTFYFASSMEGSFLVPSIISSIWSISFHHRVWGRCNSLFSFIILTS